MVSAENVVPLEIKKRGPKAVQVFIHALNEGKQKIPYCGLLILGRQQVGKTSLYRQLVRLPFMINLDSTRGIDNNTVDTVEKRPVGVVKGKWREKDREVDRSERFIGGLSKELIDSLPPNPQPEAAQGGEEVGEEELLVLIQSVIDTIKKEPVGNHVPDTPPTKHDKPSDNPPTKRRRKPPKGPKTALPATTGSRPPKIAHKLRPKHSVGATPQKTMGPPPPEGKVEPDPAPPSPTPDDPGTPVERGNPTPRLELWESVKINKMMKAHIQDKKEPSLLLNTLDFAGQEIYRPMHYCFISRRALYIVVFKIPDMLESIAKKLSSNVVIEEIRYWINSVHARIYPPEEQVEKEDKKMNRVFLVGTHRGDTSVEDLRKIDSELKKVLIMDSDHCVNHIHRRSSDQNLCFFFPVENSTDFQKSENYLEESGTKLFQDELETKCGELSFLNKDHPRKWLKFEESLELCDVSRSAPIMSLEDVKRFARRAGIVGEDMQDLALKFLHDTGKIIYLDCLPHLFLTEAEHKQLAGHVILRPQWLMSIMQVVMELTTDREEQNLSQDLVKGVEKDGVADLELLEVCWQKFLPESLSDVRIHHLCLILQAYCLIYPCPIESDTTAETNGTVPRKYIIPCKLPGQFRGKELQPKNCATFYFDFNHFLPVEIYHKLICLASSKAKPRFGTRNQYSRSKCSFSGLMETKWVMEIEQDKHRLKIMAIVGRDEGSPKPKKYLIFIHKFLQNICKESGLKGLEYHGGPVDRCDRCGDDVMFCCVEFCSGEDEVHAKASCTECFEKYDINKLLYLADFDQSNLLGMEKLKDVMEMVYEIAAAYKNFGLALNLSSSFLEVVEADGQDCHKCLKEVVVEWLKGNGGKCSWKFLSNAIGGSLVGNKALADKIEQKYCRN